MGRPRKLNLSQNSDFDYNVTIQVSVKDIAIDTNVSTFTKYTFYTDSHMFELPSIKIITKQLSSILKRSDENIVIQSISL